MAAQRKEEAEATRRKDRDKGQGKKQGRDGLRTGKGRGQADKVKDILLTSNGYSM